MDLPACRHKASLNFQEVQSTTPSCAWYSPSATNINTPYADLELLAGVEASGCGIGQVKDAAAGSIMDVQYRFVFCVQSTIGAPASDADQWYLPLTHFPDSAVMVWPMTKHRIPNSTEFYFEFDLSAPRPVFVNVLSLRTVVGCHLTWRSWLWQYQRFPHWRPSLEVSIKGFVGAEMPLLRLAASRCFWTMSMAQVIGLCKREGKAVEDSGSLCAVLASAVSNVLECDEAATLDALSLRLPDDECCNAFSSAVQEIDEAVEVLEQFDHETVKQEQETAATRIAAKVEFQRAYAERRKAWRLARESNKKRAAPKHAVKKGELPTEMTQAQANKFIPPGTTIWRGVVQGSWQGHCEPFARVYESWRRSSEPEAMRRVIRTLWEQHIAKHGLDRSACPWAGILD